MLSSEYEFNMMPINSGSGGNISQNIKKTYCELRSKSVEKIVGDKLEKENGPKLKNEKKENNIVTRTNNEFLEEIDIPTEYTDPENADQVPQSFDEKQQQRNNTKNPSSTMSKKPKIGQIFPSNLSLDIFPLNPWAHNDNK